MSYSLEIIHVAGEVVLLSPKRTASTSMLFEIVESVMLTLKAEMNLFDCATSMLSNDIRLLVNSHAIRLSCRATVE